MEFIKTSSTRILQFYAISQKWSSEIQFSVREVRFLNKLILEHLMYMGGSKHIDGLIHASNQLSDLDMEIAESDKMLLKHIADMEKELIKDVITDDLEVYSVTQVKLEYLVTNITLRYREIKNTLFSIVEDILDNKEVLA